MRVLVLALLLTAAGVAGALAGKVGDLEGVWTFSFASWNGSYTGSMSISGDGAATSDLTTPTRTTRQTGTASISRGVASIAFTAATNGYLPDTLRCTFSSKDSLNCTSIDSAGNGSTGFTATRLTVSRAGPQVRPPATDGPSPDRVDNSLVTRDDRSAGPPIKEDAPSGPIPSLGSGR